jgi:hypothetical protein
VAGGGILKVAQPGDRYVRVLGEHNGEIFYELSVFSELTPAISLN